MPLPGFLRPWLRPVAALGVVAAVAVSGGTGLPDIGALFGGTRAIDGDTIAIGRQRYRLHGIDAPEAGQQCQDAAGSTYDCGKVARAALAGMVNGHPVTCEQRSADTFGRPVAVCRANGLDLGGELVRQGHAVAYTRYSRDYAREQREAQVAKRGIWAGRSIDPEAFRAARRL